MAIATPDRTPASNPARLVAVSGPLTGEVLPLADTGVTIGRDTSNDICLADMALSRAHCTIDKTGGIWHIRDVNQLERHVCQRRPGERPGPSRS